MLKKAKGKGTKHQIPLHLREDVRKSDDRKKECINEFYTNNLSIKAMNMPK